MWGTRRGLLVAAALLSPSAGLAQVQVNQTFNAQGPGPAFGNVYTIHSADAGNSNGTVVGAIQAVVPNPALGANTIFAASANGGIWVTNNGGTSWTPLTDKQASLSIASLALDPTDTTGNTLIAGTGLTSNGIYDSFNRANRAGAGGQQTGLLYTTNGGATWSALGTTALANQTVIGVVARGNAILAGTFEPQAPSVSTTTGGAAYGLYSSTNGGASFNLVSLPVSGPVSSLVGDPTNLGTIYAAVSSANSASYKDTSIFVSPDGGSTWNKVFDKTNSAGKISNANQTSITLSTGPNGSIAAGVINDSTNQLAGVFLSQDGGRTWHQLTAPQVNPGSQAPVNFAIKIDPTNPNIVYISGDAYQSTSASVFTVEAFRINYNPTAQTSTYTSLTSEGTPTYFQNANTVHADSRALAFDSSGRLILTSDGGIYALTNPQGSGTWQGLNGNLMGFENYRVAFDANSKRLVVAAQDNGAAYQSGQNNSQYSAIQAGDGNNAVVNDRSLSASGLSAIYTTYQSLGTFARLVVDANGNTVSPTTINPYTQQSGYQYYPAGVLVTCNGGNDCSSEVRGAYFSSPVVLNRINPSMIALAGSKVYITQDPLTNVTTASSVDLKLTDLGSTGNNPAGNSQQVTAIAYGTQDNTTALLVGAGDRTGTGTVGTVFLNTSGTAGSLPASRLTQYAGLTPTSVVFDARTYARFFVADSVNLWYSQNGSAAPANVNFGNLTSNLPAGFIRPTSVEFISNNGVNALLVGGLNSPLSCNSSPNGCIISSQQTPITVADSDTNGNVSGWRALGSGLPNALIYQMVYNPTVDVLAVSAIGRGAWTLYDVTSYFPQATVLQFGLANNDSQPDASFLTDGTALGGGSFSRPLNKYGTGTLTIAGNATYTGGTTIFGGVLQLGNGGMSGSILGNVVFCSDASNSLCDPSTNKMLVFNRSDTYAFDGAITGPGQVVQFGTGKTILTAASTYSGPTYVLGGTLSVNGSIASSVFVDAGGTLRGNGTVGPATILAGGTLSPGNSVGTLTVNGNLVFAAASFYLVQVQGNTADRVNVSGTATLAGTVGVSNLGGNLTHSYTIVSASAGLNGTFNAFAAANLPAFITANLAYTPTDVDLILTSGIGLIAGLTRNQSAVAAALDTSFNSGGGTLPALFGLTQSQLPAALDMLSGEGVSGAQESAFGAAGMFTSMMMDQGAFWRNGETIDVNGVTFAGEPLSYAPSKKSKTDHPAFKALLTKEPPMLQPRWRAWLTGFDGTAKLAGEAGIGSATLSHNTGGLAAGLDYQFAPDLLAGFAMGGSSSNFSVRDRITSGNLEGEHFGGYAVKTWREVYAAGTLAFGTFRNSETRSIVGIGPTETATGSFGSNLLSGRVEVGSKQTFNWFTVTPFAAVQFAELWQNGFTETNAVPPGAAGPLGLSYGRTSVPSLPTFVGTELNTRIGFANGMVLSPYARASWVHEFEPNRAINASFIALPGAAFTVDGPRAASDAVRIDAGTKLVIRWNAWLFASFDGEFSSRSQSYAGKAGARVAW
jgi:autotransporter-associated beta strand protein